MGMCGSKKLKNGWLRNNLLTLAFDTSSPVLTVAIGNEERIIEETTLWLPRGHMARLIPTIDDLFKKSNLSINDVEVIVIGSGPGSYTGLRIGMVMARTLAQSLGVSIIGIASIDAIAYRNLENNALVCPVIDAKRGEVYTAFYHYMDGELRRLTDFKAINPEDLSNVLLAEGYGKVLFAGDALKLYSDVFSQALGDKAIFAHEDNWWPRASDLIRLAEPRIRSGDYNELYQLTPIYVRLSQAEEMWEKRHRG